MDPADHPASETLDDEQFTRDEPVGRVAAAAIAELVGGELGRSETRCHTVLDRSVRDAGSARDRRIAGGVLAVIAYLRGDYTLAQRLGGGAVEGRPIAGARGSPDLESAPPDLAVRALVVPPMVLAHQAVGASDEAHALLDAHPLPSSHRSALELLVGNPAANSTAAAFTAPDHDRDRPSDLAIGVAAAATLGCGHRSDAGAGERRSTPARRAWLDTLRTAEEAGHRVSLTVPVSVERAHACALALCGDLDRASAKLEVAEHRWRGQDAYTELAEVLVLQAELAVALGRQRGAKDLASEAYSLADRLGLRAARTRALSLYHPNLDSLDLGTPEERLVLVSDVVGSTRVSTTEGDEAYYDLIMTHHDTIRPLLERYGGREFSEGGDSLLAWFEVPEEALDCALEILEAVEACRRAGCELHVRLSLAGGQPFFRNGRPYGRAVHLASRLLPKGNPGQIVVDEVTLALLGPAVPDFDRRTIELDEFGTQAVGFLPPEPVR